VTGRAAPDLSDLASPWKADPKAVPRSRALVKETLTYGLGLGPSATVADLDIDPGTNTVGDKIRWVTRYWRWWMRPMPMGRRAIRRS
jgi:hypothetical protein